MVWIAELMELLPCRTFCECSVGPLEISQAKGFIGKCRSMLLIEPHPKLAASASTQFQIPVIHTAIGFKPGKQVLLDNNGSSYLEGTWAPTMVKTPVTSYTVPVVTFDTIDDGEIDIMVLDCEGMEWAVLSNMKSRPELLGIEIWGENPYKKEIFDGLHDQHYVLRLSSGPTNETRIYTRADNPDP